MNTIPRILRLYVPRSWPRPVPSCAWSIVSRGGEVIAKGNGDAGSWPRADECEVVLTAEQVSWLSISLPERMGRDADRIIAYALEEKLLEPPETMHIVIVSTAGREKSAIAIRRERLREIIAAIGAHGRRLDRVYTEMQLASCAEGAWTACCCGDSAFLMLGSDRGMAVDWLGVAPPDELLLAVARARTRGELPQRIDVKVPPDRKPATDAWADSLGIPVVTGRSFDPLAATGDEASNLLTGPFAPTGTATVKAGYVRWSFFVLLAAGLFHTALSLGEWAWLAYRASQLRGESNALYRAAVPDSKAPLLDPNVQLQREANRVLHERGKTGRSDMLAMLAALGRALPPGVQARRMKFDQSGLEVVGVLPEDAVGRLGPALRLHGYAVEATVLRQDSAGYEYRIRVRLL